MTYYIKADRFLLEEEEKSNGYLHVIDGRFGKFVDEVPSGEVIHDWSGYTIAPGLFDTHIHGISGYDVMDGTEEALNGISKTLLSLGVTRFLPTTLTSSKEALESAIVVIRDAVKNKLPGAKSEGIFLEGPYFTEKHKGAQNSSYFRNPDFNEFQSWQHIADNQIIKIALAPERSGSMDFIQKVTNEGIYVGLAHTEASYDCCSQAVGKGANIFVHLFNGMSGLHHRNPGVVGAAFAHSDTFAELICDGFHVHPDVSVLALQTKKDKLVLITDCMRAGSMPDGEYYLGEFLVEIRDGIAHTKTGSLAGSTLTLLDGVKNMVKWSGHSLNEIWHLASLSPAKSVGKEKELGSIVYGKFADYVVLDKTLDIKATAIEGILKYKR